MRVWLLLVLIGCRDTHESQPAKPLPLPSRSVVAPSASATSPASTNAGADDAMGRRIADEIMKLRDDWLVYLHDIGWIQVQNKYGAARLFFVASPNLVAELEHRPPPKPPAAWRDERGRYMAAIHDGDQNPPGEDPSLDVISLDWSIDFIDRLRRDLVANRSVTIPHVCSFRIEPDAKGAHVVFDASPELVQRLRSH